MASKYWIKLWIEILDDPKMGKMPDWKWRRTIELFLLAGENGNDGELQPVGDLAWRLRVNEIDLVTTLQDLERVGVTELLPDGRWKVKNFLKRNEAIGDADRQRMRRESSRKEEYYSHEACHDVVTKRDIDTDTESEPETEKIDRAGEADDEFSKLQRICEKLTGRLMVPPRDVETINTFVKNGAVEEDITRAVAWFQGQGKVISTIGQIQGAVLYQIGARRQAETAKNAPAATPNGHKAKSAEPKGMAAIRQYQSQLREEASGGKRADS